MRLALFQGPDPATTPRDASIDAIVAAAAAAAAEHADILVCPEMAATGYNIGPLVASLAEAPDGAIFERLSAVAREHDLAIVYGYPERATNGSVFNAVHAIGRDGEGLAHYRKCHLFGDLDRGLFVAGDNPVAQFAFEGARVGLLICYDVEFPEAVRAHALAGTDVLLVPTGNMEPYGRVNTLLVPARAMENQLFIAYANRCGTEGNVTYVGLSCVVGPDGADIARAGADEQLLYADIDLGVLPRARAANPYLADRRPELYGSITGEPQ